MRHTRYLLHSTYIIRGLALDGRTLRNQIHRLLEILKADATAVNDAPALLAALESDAEVLSLERYSHLDLNSRSGQQSINKLLGLLSFRRMPTHIVRTNATHGDLVSSTTINENELYGSEASGQLFISDLRYLETASNPQEL
jgi:hypothetical protein